MEWRFHRYQIPWSPSHSRTHTGEGLLIEANLEGVKGYASLHPWVNLGDLPVSKQLEDLSLGRPTNLMQVALQLAEKDARARKEQKGGVRFLPSIKNHCLFLHPELSLPELQGWYKKQRALNPSGHLIIKWKISPAQAESTASLLNRAAEQWPDLQWRLDANALFEQMGLAQFWNSLSKDAQKQIQFIEDPCPYDLKNWNSLEAMGVPLAIDFETRVWIQNPVSPSPTESGNTILVLKPEAQDMSFWQNWLKLHPHRFFITSYLGHPVGLLHALWIAETFSEEFPQLLQTCGLNLAMTREQMDQLCPSLHQREDWDYCWQGTASLGIGETATLEELEWKPLSSILSIQN